MQGVVITLQVNTLALAHTALSLSLSVCACLPALLICHADDTHSSAAARAPNLSAVRSSAHNGEIFHFIPLAIRAIFQLKFLIQNLISSIFTFGKMNKSLLKFK